MSLFRTTDSLMIGREKKGMSKNSSLFFHILLELILRQELQRELQPELLLQPSLLFWLSLPS